MENSLRNINISGYSVRRAKFPLWYYLLLIFFGLVFTLSGLYFFGQTRIDSSWKWVEGKVVEVKTTQKRDDDTNKVDTSYTPTIMYTIDGKSYKVQGKFSSRTKPEIGSSWQVAYNPDKPDQAKFWVSSASKVTSLLSLFIGIAILILTLFMICVATQRSRRIKKLIQTGQRVEGVLFDIRQMKPNSKSKTYKLVIAAKNSTGAMQYYTSDPVTGSGALQNIDFRNSTIPIAVYIDTANSKQYFVDTSTL